jgi:hypothetical protein
MSHNGGTPSYILMTASVHSADLGALYARESVCGHYKSKPLCPSVDTTNLNPSVRLWTL